jgi:hypothetical protein
MLVDRKTWQETAWQRRLREVLSEGGAEQVLELAVPVGVRDGVFELAVENTSAAGYLRLGWSLLLVELFQARLPEAGVHAVRFVPRETT